MEQNLPHRGWQDHEGAALGWSGRWGDGDVACAVPVLKRQRHAWKCGAPNTSVMMRAVGSTCI